MSAQSLAAAPHSRFFGVRAGLTVHGLSLLVIGLAVIIRLWAPIDPNIDWLMTNCRRFLDGATLYRDIVETNPPMAIFIYLPGALIERFTGVPAEPVYTALVLLAGTGSAGVFCRCVRRAGIDDKWLWPLCLFAVLVAPLASFAEREHIALILILPLLGVALLRASGQKPPLPLLAVAGLLAGLIPMIKPHFALGIIAVYVALAVQKRDPRLLLAPEAALAALLTAAYLLLVWRFMPAYGDQVVPMLLDLYRPMRLPLTAMPLAYKLGLWLLGLICLIFAARKQLFQPLPFVLLAAAFGFLLGFADQGRGWPYHALPFVSLSLIAVASQAPSLLRADNPAHRMATVAALLTALMPLAYMTGFTGRYDKVVRPIRVAVDHPTVMSISFDLTPGHPIATEVRGTWIGTYSSRWITVNAHHLLVTTTDPAKRTRLEHWIAYDRAVTNQDLAKRPDVVLVGLGPFNWPGWIATDPETRRLFSAYTPLAEDRLTPRDRQRYEGVEAFIRKDLLAQPR